MPGYFWSRFIKEVLSDGSPVGKTELKTGEAPYKAVFFQYFCIYDISNFTNGAKKLSYNEDMHNILSW